MERFLFRGVESREAGSRGVDCKCKEVFCFRVFSYEKLINSWLFLARRQRI
jgi:hypothetical protein